MHFSPVVIAAGREEMFIINKENLDETRIEKIEPENNSWEFVDIIGGEAPASQDPGATQRVFVTEYGVSTVPVTPTERPLPTPQRRSANAEQRAAAAAARKKKEKITIITLCSIVAVLLIAVVVVIVGTLGSTNDNGLIFNNVFAAGVDVDGGTLLCLGGIAADGAVTHHIEPTGIAYQYGASGGGDVVTV